MEEENSIEEKKRKFTNTTLVGIPKDKHLVLKQLSMQENRSMSKILVEALEEYVDEHHGGYGSAKGIQD